MPLGVVISTAISPLPARIPNMIPAILAPVITFLSHRQRLRKIWLATLLSFVLYASPCLAAEPELVGTLALALQPEVAEQLKISDRQRQTLYDLADEIEMKGIEQALRVKDMPRAERLKELAPLRAEAERRMMALLSRGQREQLEKLKAESENAAFAGGNVGEKREVEREEREIEKESEGDLAGGEDAPARAEMNESVEVPTSNEETLLPADGRLSFNFRYQPWQEVLDWFAERADLSLVLEAAPPGTLNYRDNRDYTVAEALDVLNSVLLTKGYTLVRKGRMLLLVNLQDGIPPSLVTDVPLDELDQRGEYELVRVLFRVGNLLPQEAADELRELIGPQGTVTVLPKAGMVHVTETAGRIRMLRRVIETIEQPAGGMGGVREFPLEYLTAEELLPVLRQLFAIPPDQMATPNGSLQLAVDPLGLKLYAQGPPVQLERLNEILKMVDVASGSSGGSIETPQLEVYSTAGADPELVLQVLQTLLLGSSSTRLATDAQTGNLVALATPSQHKTIQATLEQMLQDARKIEVIPLDRVDPQLAVLSVTKLFSSGTADEPDPRAPTIDADLSSRSLIVRATPAQIEQIRGFIDQLDENSSGGPQRGTGNVRLLPLSPSEARSAITQLEQFWPMIRPNNKIRIVSPSAAIPSYTPSEGSDNAQESDEDEMRALEQFFQGTGAQAPIQQRPPSPGVDRSARINRRVPARFAKQPANESESSPPKPLPTNAPIVIAPGPGGTIIASQDTEALDAFEDLLRQSTTDSLGGRQFAVFYLRYADAAAAAQTLSKIFGGGSDSGGLVGDIAGAALGDMGGGLMGDLLGLGSGGSSSSGFASTAVDIVPDMRLNALVIYAQPDDLDMIDQLLRVLDQRTGPEQVEAGGKPRLVPVYNTSAAQVAEVVKQVYQDRLQGAGGGGGGGQPSPQELIRAIRRGAQGGGSGPDPEEATKMSIGVDERSNSLVVRAPDPLFEEVERLVRQLDEKGIAPPKATRVVTLEHTNSATLKDALTSLLGENAVTSTTTGGRRPDAGGGSSEKKPEAGSDNEGAAREMQQRMEMFREMRRAMERGRGDRRGGDRRRGERGRGDR